VLYAGIFPNVIYLNFNNSTIMGERSLKAWGARVQSDSAEAAFEEEGMPFEAGSW